MNGEYTWEELIDRHLRGELDEADIELLAEQLDNDADKRRAYVEYVKWDTEVTEALRESLHAFDESEIQFADFRSSPGERPTKSTAIRLLLAAASVVIVALSIGLYVQNISASRRIAELNATAQRPLTDQPIATVSGLSGSLLWTGDGGRVVRDLSVGTELAGGTIEGMSPESWFELKFHDDSSVMISGTSMLTFSDQGQKLLHLKSGSMAANVVPQAVGRPMLIHTRSALLTVVGTSFEVEAGLASTGLNVSDGEVRLKRLSDGQSVNVPANHRLIATADQILTPEKLPDSVNHWKSQLSKGPERSYGEWSPATNDKRATLKAIPFVPQENQSVTLHLLGLPVSRADNSPVVVKSGSRFVLRGRLSSDAGIFFGMSVAHPNGELAGKFRTTPTSKIKPDNNHEFEAIFHLTEFDIDPSVEKWKDQLSARPDNLILTGVWCFTLTGVPSGLEITEVELIPREVN